MQNFAEILKKKDDPTDPQRKDSFLLLSHDRGAADGGFMQMWSIRKGGAVQGPTGEIIVMDGRDGWMGGWVHATVP